MRYRVVRNISDIKETDIVVDSSFPKDIECTRIDHHVDNCMTNIDSIYQAFKNNPDIRGDCIVTSTIDTDSVISAALIDLLLSGELESINDTLLKNDIFKIMYSACHWCDYNIGYENFPEDINRKGELFDLYTRQELQIYIGLSYREKVVSSDQNQTFEKLIAKTKEIIKKGKLPLHILEFPRDDVYGELTEISSKCIIRNQFENNFIGYIKMPDNEHLLPRIYFKLFKQPLIGRITFMEDNEISVLIGINPHAIKEWRKVNLIKLADILNKKNPSISFSGRRNVIRARFNGDIESLYGTVTDIKIETLYDEEKLFGMYE